MNYCYIIVNLVSYPDDNDVSICSLRILHNMKTCVYNPAYQIRALIRPTPPEVERTRGAKEFSHPLFIRASFFYCLAGLYCDKRGMWIKYSYMKDSALSLAISFSVCAVL